MAIPAALVFVPVGVLFFLSGLTVNAIQALFFILLRPLSRSLYRRINKVIAELLWLELVWLFDWWAGIKINLYADAETMELIGKEHALVICNHRSDVDWLVGWVVAERSGCLGTTLALMKKEVKYLPIIGWSMWFSGYIFLERSWNKDEKTLKSGLNQLEDFPMPFWLALFVEGTRFTEAKLLAAREFAASRGLPVPRNVLIPRTKGFVAAVNHIRSFVPAIYDCTYVVSKAETPPTLLRMLSGQSSVVNLQIKRHPMKGLPETDEGIAQWCRDVFVTKDALLERYQETGTFSDLILLEPDRPCKSLLVFTAWTCLLGAGLVTLCLYYVVLVSWQMMAFASIFLVVVIVVMQVLVETSKSDCSTPPKESAVEEDPVRETLIKGHR